MKLHPLSTDITKPERFTYPFCYEPHPLCLLAAEEVKQEIARINPTAVYVYAIKSILERIRNHCHQTVYIQVTYCPDPGLA